MSRKDNYDGLYLTRKGWAGKKSGKWTNKSNKLMGVSNSYGIKAQGVTANTRKGDDVLAGQTGSNPSSWADGFFIESATINTNQGNDIVAGKSSEDAGIYIHRGSRVLMGKGKDAIRSYGQDVGFFLGDSLIDFGSEADILECEGKTGEGLRLSQSATILMGDGNDRITTRSNGTDGFGSGIWVDGLIDMGEGDDLIDTLLTKDLGFHCETNFDLITMGGGNDTFKGVGDGIVDGGTGTDTFVLPSGSYRVRRAGSTVTISGSVYGDEWQATLREFELLGSAQTGATLAADSLQEGVSLNLVAGEGISILGQI